MHTPLVNASESREPLPAHQAILPWLGLLRQLYPPRAVLLVGAGSGTSPWVQHLMATGHRNVTLIEADEAAAKRLKLATQGQPDWNVEPHVIGRHSEATAFYTASLQTESGLLEPEALRSLWPNLKTIQKQTRQTVTLAKLLESAETPANWLLLDCLPALPIIQGAASQLAGIDVIAVRVVLNAQALPGSGASAEELQPALQALGFRCLAVEASRHPAMGQALFVRDTAAQARQLQQQLADKAQTTTEAQAKVKQLAAEHQQHINQLQAQLKQATEQAQAAAQEAEKAKAAAAAQATQHAKTAAEAQATATTATAAATKQAEERAAQVQQLTQAKAAADKLLADRMAQIQAHEQRLQQLQAHSAETDHLNGLLQAEVSKAEAQIGLLKELFLREQSQ